jgi:hypothetical protein
MTSHTIDWGGFYAASTDDQIDTEARCGRDDHM